MNILKHERNEILRGKQYLLSGKIKQKKKKKEEEEGEIRNRNKTKQTSFSEKQESLPFPECIYK